MERLTEELLFLKGKLYNGIFKDRIWCIDKAIELIREFKQYKDVEEQGLLLRLPCKVGTKVYQIHTLQKTGKKVVAEVETDAFMLSLCMLEERFGKTVFLTKEEAEQALKQMGE